MQKIHLSSRRGVLGSSVGLFIFFSVISSGIFASSPALAIQRGEEVKVVFCNDGDTCGVLRTTGEQIKVRLGGIDAPERGQDFYMESKRYLEGLIKNRFVKLECNGFSGTRAACIVFLDGRNINAEMVIAGYAWDYPTHSRRRYGQMQQDAENDVRGLWSGENIMSPFCFRFNQGFAAKECAENPRYQL
ncbi:MAG: thermonuclease family protein [Bdellovibrionales bacterium]|jgi:micrococcal nuclease|nr:thermonuclease family protein [Bdellovibrionales bacterium]